MTGKEIRTNLLLLQFQEYTHHADIYSDGTIAVIIYPNSIYTTPHDPETNREYKVSVNNGTASNMHYMSFGKAYSEVLTALKRRKRNFACNTNNMKYSA